ncbi:hypothetical protein [Deinococcus cellulosilyticus]|uniref:Uncharacterized protein n=1 Tax=Deinococcus cellulosilyticus (strain DSM 18568 / NBRC 106333 / KACC 11606 / 5516J-15) TaxID=1223518 RepID=A0A511NAW5_DEIC1|nr:hypothetical protein [Deinococcus cellulosilyticus]GEM49950.1 hypothetical protein DC3_55850 [Deinococcus cellulosilyticus NBRC 106333 = KACC 11606]
MKLPVTLLTLFSIAGAQMTPALPEVKADLSAVCCREKNLVWPIQKQLTLPVLPDLQARKFSLQQRPQPLPNYRPGTYRPIPIPTTFPDAKLVPLKFPALSEKPSDSTTTKPLVSEDTGAQGQQLLFR